MTLTRSCVMTRKPPKTMPRSAEYKAGLLAIQTAAGGKTSGAIAVIAADHAVFEVHIGFKSSTARLQLTDFGVRCVHVAPHLEYPRRSPAPHGENDLRGNFLPVEHANGLLEKRRPAKRSALEPNWYVMRF
jgi:hypothetical protein